MELEKIEAADVKRKLLLKQKKLNKMRELMFILVVIAYPLVNFIIFYLYKNSSSIIMAFQEYDLDYKLHWVGFKNFRVFFKDLFTPGNVYVVGLKNNLISYMVSLCIYMPMQFLLSFFLYKKAPLSGTYRFVMMIPSIISSVLVGLMFIRFINALPRLMTVVGFSDFPNLLKDKNTRFATTIFYEFWNGFGTAVIYYFNAMNGIDDELVESAQLDGITFGKEFFYITFPMIFPTVSTFLITGFSSILGAEGPLYVFWRLDAPTDVYRFGYILFRITMVDGEAGYTLVSAIGLLCTCIVFPLAMMLRKFLKRIDPNN